MFVAAANAFRLNNDTNTVKVENGAIENDQSQESAMAII